MHRSRVAVTVLGILGWAATAQAGDTLEAPPATRPLADTPIRLVLPRALHALAAAASLPFVWVAVRETRGKSLEQM